MVKEHLEVFARVKPYEYDSQICPNFSLSNETIELQVARNKLSNAKDNHQFNFNRIFHQSTQQSQIFEVVAQPVIDNCLDGYNGTIFAYGQTGSGKTYTMSGGDDWEQRGIIPRVLSYVFDEFKRRSKKYCYELQVSFIEIYNQNAYDLLNERHNENNFDQWTKIVFMEDEDSNLQMKNVKIQPVCSEQEALNFLMMGNYMRKINSTNLNQTSSRSHCIFTLNIKGKNLLTLTEVYSKIHLVDLAGSQRVSKSQAEGIVLTEAKSINLSLTYLEQVIVSLNQKNKSKSKPHIPYRNSLLTTLLRDSLGGNCKTVMIATISMQKSNLDETVSTLRFAQRVKLIENDMLKNQKNVYSSKIQQLERQNLLLKKKLSKFEGSDDTHIQNEEQMQQIVENYMNFKDSTLQVQSISQANKYLKKMKSIHYKRMNQYITELTFISQKIMKYEEVLSKKQNRRKQV